MKDGDELLAFTFIGIIGIMAMFEEKESRELVKRGRSDADSDS